MKTAYNLKKIVTATAFTVTIALLFCRCELPPTGGGNGNGGADKHHPDTAWYADNPKASAFDIITADELAGLALLVNREDSPVDFNGKTITLAADIDLSAHYGKKYDNGHGWTAIGTKGMPFRGIFDGGGKAVNGLYINAKDYYNAGLFGYVDGKSAVIKNLGLSNVNIAAGKGSGLGSVAGRAMGGSGVIDCYAKGIVSGNNYIGGILGEIVGGELKNCFFEGNVSGTSNASGFIGGVVGNVNNVTVANCYSINGNVSGTQAIGGVIGYIDGENTTNVVSCYSTVSVGSLFGECGGVVGLILNSARITDCAALNKSMIYTENLHVGRIVGYYDPESDVTLSGNVAFSGMEGSAAWDNIGAGKIDGADIDKEAINSDGTLGGRFKPADGWATQDGKLPGLGGAAAEMPEHLR